MIGHHHSGSMGGWNSNELDGRPPQQLESWVPNELDGDTTSHELNERTGRDQTDIWNGSATV